MLPEGTDVEQKLKKKATPLQKIFQKAAKVSRGNVGVKVGGLDSVMVRYGKCCEPLPGDRIVGFITRGRGVTIHNSACPEVMNVDPQRLIEVSWDSDYKGLRRVCLVVHGQDQKGLLAQITKVITDLGGDIKSAQIKTTEYQKATISFEMLVADSQQLRKIKRSIEMIAGVIKVERAKNVDTD